MTDIVIEEGTEQVLEVDEPTSSTITVSEVGENIELGKVGGYIAWRYVGDSSWTNLVALADLQGEQGDPGVGTIPFVHTQSTPAATWSVTHNLGYRPSSVRVQDSAEDEIDDFDIVNETVNSFDLVFSGAFSGSARIK